ncbi:D-2-hydroxyacid dehydrogenase [uncultured Jannaschia sp.]|uniref:D-2-hydroxyacid dehydrogenase n=1 Tax=uncultured Jannaschia sp. TaxID=293347 RepID=UPI002632BAD4|nr:D-2-hydroxyacid dehydrogenase [uncultured Jannaschia sp.]
MLNAFISTPLETAQVDRIRAAAAGRVEVIYEPDLLPPVRYRGDHKGVDGYVRAPEAQERFARHLVDAHILFDMPPLHMLPVRDLSFAPNLRWVQTTSSGVGPVIEALGLKNSGVLVTTARGVHAVPLAEFAMMAILMHVKDLPRLRADQADHRWERRCGESLVGKRVAIIGAGEVGGRVADVCRFHGMRVAAMSRTLTARMGQERGYGEVFTRADLARVAGESDAIVLTVPHTPETDGMIDRTVLAAIRSDAVFVNIARGSVVDEGALIEALQARRIGFAALDVTAVEPLPEDSPLWDLPNVLISPHSASTVAQENGLIADLFMHNMDCLLRDEPERMRNRFDMEAGY